MDEASSRRTRLGHLARAGTWSKRARGPHSSRIPWLWRKAWRTRPRISVTNREISLKVRIKAADHLCVGKTEWLPKHRTEPSEDPHQ